jgi:hypothetical protein
MAPEAIRIGDSQASASASHRLFWMTIPGSPARLKREIVEGSVLCRDGTALVIKGWQERERPVSPLSINQEAQP